MSRKYFISIVCVMSFLQAPAQLRKDIIVTPGTGIGNIKLGMTEKEVKEIKPGTYHEADFLQKLWEYKDSDNKLIIDSLIQFVLGFEKMITASDEMFRKDPVYNMAFKDDKLNYISISSYSQTDQILKSVVIDGQLKFFMPQDECMQLMGDDFLSISYRDYTCHIYYNRGIETIYDEGKLRCVIIFEKTPGYLEQITRRRDLLLQQFRSIQEQ